MQSQTKTPVQSEYGTPVPYKRTYRKNRMFSGFLEIEAGFGSLPARRSSGIPGESRRHLSPRLSERDRFAFNDRFQLHVEIPLSSGRAKFDWWNRNNRITIALLSSPAGLRHAH